MNSIIINMSEARSNESFSLSITSPLNSKKYHTRRKTTKGKKLHTLFRYNLPASTLHRASHKKDKAPAILKTKELDAWGELSVKGMLGDKFQVPYRERGRGGVNERSFDAEKKSSRKANRLDYTKVYNQIKEDSIKYIGNSRNGDSNKFRTAKVNIKSLKFRDETFDKILNILLRNRSNDSKKEKELPCIKKAAKYSQVSYKPYSKLFYRRRIPGIYLSERIQRIALEKRLHSEKVSEFERLLQRTANSGLSLYE
eukprot:TRINITY_DN13235_c0_g2_i2.p1 TRINITY_DN13235_c0_g2~~TRINITY_DN13235_c0_g2_i2.p1  ORF type:complete len:274 (-),score=47.46 TRINITY_DN13235_c0_g2_i2:275-1039(-)